MKNTFDGNYLYIVIEDSDLDPNFYKIKFITTDIIKCLDHIMHNDKYGMGVSQDISFIILNDEDNYNCYSEIIYFNAIWFNFTAKYRCLTDLCNAFEKSILPEDIKYNASNHIKKYIDSDLFIEEKNKSIEKENDKIKESEINKLFELANKYNYQILPEKEEG